MAATKRAIAEAVKKEQKDNTVPSLSVSGEASSPGAAGGASGEREKGERGGMDNMLAALRSGNAFRRYSANITGLVNPNRLSANLGRVDE